MKKKSGEMEQIKSKKKKKTYQKNKTQGPLSLLLRVRILHVRLCSFSLSDVSSRKLPWWNKPSASENFLLSKLEYKIRND